MPIAKSVEDTVLGEAKAGSYKDMLGIVSVIDNRSSQLGVSYDDVVSAADSRGRQQFDAYNKALPAGVSKYRDLARQAIAEVREKGPVHKATFYAAPAAEKGLPKGLAFETKTPGHNFYSDPQQRSIATAQGYKTPDPTASRYSDGLTNVAGAPSGTLYDVAAPAAPSMASLGVPNVAPAPAAPSVAAPSTAGLASLTGTTAYGFPTYAPTVDLEDRALSAVKGVASYNPGAQRSLDPTTGVVEATQQAVTKSFGPGYSIGVVSGQEPKGLAAVGSRANHPGGYAIDFDVLDPMGNPVNVKDPQVAAAMKGVHTSLAATGRGIGYGQGYMTRPDGTMGRTHVGTPPGSSVVGWGRSLSRDSMDPSLYSELSQAKATGVSLPSFGPEVGTKSTSPFSSILGEVGMPAKGPQFSPEYSPAPSVAAPSTYAAPVGPVTRSALSPIGTTTPAGFTELGAIGKMGRVGPTISQQVAAMTPAIAMPTQQPYFAPAAVPVPTMRPAVAPAIVAPPVAPPVAAPVSVGPARAAPAPMATAADVWGGVAQTGRATNGNVVSRGPDGNISMTSSKYGYTDTMSPAGDYRGTTAPGFLGIDAAARSMFSGPRGGIGPAAKGMAGSIAGGLIGGSLGPVGGLVGAAIGRSLASGGLQAARGFGPSQAPSISRGLSSLSRGIGPSMKGMAGGVAGGLFGGALGPFGGLFGAAIGRSLASGRSQSSPSGSRSGVESMSGFAGQQGSPSKGMSAAAEKSAGRGDAKW